jgi:DNA polymerase-3 subunit delta'
LALVCERSTADLVACRSCHSCIQALAGTHPDIDLVEKPVDRATIPLELLIGSPDQRLREGLCWRLLLRPAIAHRKIAILLDADHLSEEAANCLLKTLEEPPPGAVIILVGTSLQRQLPTIRSRCQTVRFGLLSAATIEHVLTRELQAEGNTSSPAELAAAAAAADGSLQRARLLLSEEVTAFRRTLIGLLERQPLPGVELSRETLAVVEAAGKEAPLRRARLRVILEMTLDFYRTGLRQAASCRDARLAEFETCLTDTLEAIASIDRNANLGILIDAWSARLERAAARR